MRMLAFALCFAPTAVLAGEADVLEAFADKTGAETWTISATVPAAPRAKEIGPFARPEQVYFTDALPKTRSGKIMRRLLKDIAAGKELKQDLSTIEDVAALERLVAMAQAEQQK